MKNLNWKNIPALLIAGIFYRLLLFRKQKPIWPVRGPITSKFGQRIHPISGKTDFHNGIDIAAKSGTPVLAPLDGRVDAVYYTSAGGNQLTLRHGDGSIVTGYAHLLKRFVAQGDFVKQGQEIAQVGSTGASTGPHLHFVVRIEGGYVDPEGWCGWRISGGIANS